MAAAAAAARVVPVAAVAVPVAAVAAQAVAAAHRVVAAVVRVQVAAVAVAVPAVRVVAATAPVEAVTAAVHGAGTLRAAPVVEARAEAVGFAARETPVAPKAAIVIVRVITTRRVLLVTVTVIERGVVIETETVIETGKENLAAGFALANALASVTRSGEENVSVAAPSIPLACISRRIMAAMDTVQTLMSKAIRTACTRARTTRTGARVTIRAAHTFTSMALADFYPSLAVRHLTARHIAMVFSADMKKGTSATKCILVGDAFIHRGDG
jgi:hypothetical protein